MCQHVSFHIYAEELFNLGPEQLGYLEDKHSPEAKVGPINVSVCVCAGCIL